MPMVRYVWQATLAFCADFGTPCPPEQTPIEFVEAKPAAFDKFEDHARFIAQTFHLQRILRPGPSPDSDLLELRMYWDNLKAHAVTALG